MSPTLLELVIVVLLLLMAWLIAPLIAPGLFALLSLFWRSPRQPPPPPPFRSDRVEKNVTPPPASHEKPR